MNIGGREYPTPLVVGGVVGVGVLVLGQRLLNRGTPAVPAADSQLAAGAAPVDGLAGNLGQFPAGSGGVPAFPPSNGNYDWWDPGSVPPGGVINPPPDPGPPPPIGPPGPPPPHPVPVPVGQPPAAAAHYRATVSVATSLWNPASSRWVYNGPNAIRRGTGLIVRAARYTVGGQSCYPVSSPPAYAGDYVPANHVTLGGRA